MKAAWIATANRARPGLQKSATALLGQYAVVDRSNVDDLLKEQRTSMEVTFDASALVEAGRLVGAEGLVFVKAGCAAGRDVVDVKMTDTTLGTLCWSMHGEKCRCQHPRQTARSGPPVPLREVRNAPEPVRREFFLPPSKHFYSSCSFNSRL